MYAWQEAATPANPSVHDERGHEVPVGVMGWCRLPDWRPSDAAPSKATRMPSLLLNGRSHYTWPVMRVGYAASRTAVVVATMLSGTMLLVPPALAHHSFAPHFDAKKPADISGTVTEFEAQEPAQLPAHRRRRRERQNARVRLRIARLHAAVAQRDHAADAEEGHQDSRHRFAVAAQPVHVLLRQRGIRRRPQDERQRSRPDRRRRSRRRSPPARTSSARGCSRRSRTAAPAARSR